VLLCVCHLMFSSSDLLLTLRVIFVVAGTTNAKCVLKIIEFTLTEHGAVSVFTVLLSLLGIESLCLVSLFQ